jgi:hypothetical protein
MVGVPILSVKETHRWIRRPERKNHSGLTRTAPLPRDAERALESSHPRLATPEDLGRGARPAHCQAPLFIPKPGTAFQGLPMGG